MNDNSIEELDLLIERIEMLTQLLRVYEIVLALPKEQDTSVLPSSMRSTMYTVILSYFYSVIDDHPQGINCFRIWKEQFPESMQEIEELEHEVALIKDDLKKFRNKFGFHGSRTCSNQAKGLLPIFYQSYENVIRKIIHARRMGLEKRWRCKREIKLLTL